MTDMPTNVPTNARIIGSSILPFSIDPFYQGIYFLLGKERGGQWRGSNRWDDFGGSANENEDPCEIAAREFQEESCGIIKVYENETPIPRKSKDLIYHLLQTQAYMMHIDFQPDHNSPFVYRTYVKQVPWQPEAFQQFGLLMNELVSLKNGKDASLLTYDHPAVYNITEDKSNIKVYDGYLEKQQLAYWSIPQLRSALQKPKRLIQIRHGRKEMLRETFSKRLATILSQFRMDSLGDPTSLPLIKDRTTPAVIETQRKPPARNKEKDVGSGHGQCKTKAKDGGSGALPSAPPPSTRCIGPNRT
tara:strand:- start:879 stop:1787 length:909 start_codon:yes stop_codon:yes gene_type:complete